VTGVTVAVLAIGLFAAGMGTMVFLRNALDTNLGSQVVQLATADAARTLFTTKVEGDEVTFSPTASAPAVDYFVAIYDANGKLVATTGPVKANRPRFPETMTPLEVQLKQDSPFTVEGTRGSAFRAGVSVYQLPDSGALYSQLVALDTTSTDRVMTTFLGIYSVLALLVIVLGAVGTRWLVTLAFRSLTQVESTAMSIAAGDLGQRMTDIEPEHTEVGRLKIAINAMLGRVDAAISQRDATVRQMRRFVGDASHELRTPLVTVRGYAELYRIGAIRSDADVAQAMERIEKEAVRMGAMVEDLLALTRLDERREEFTALPIDLRPIAHDAAMDLRATSPGRTVRVVDTTRAAVAHEVVRHHVAGLAAEPSTAPRRRGGTPAAIAGATRLLRRRPRTGLNDDATAADAVAGPVLYRHVAPIVLGDENRIRQIVANVLANARRYTPDDSPVELVIGTDDTAMGWIAISDHGDGIPEQIQDQIFQRFWRADTSRTRETGGSGLGLSIVASLVETMHGTVGVEETPGGGATFRIAFPLAEERDADEHLHLETQPLPRLDRLID
jgi:two-component system OmpR family sensor kinase